MSNVGVFAAGPCRPPVSQPGRTLASVSRGSPDRSKNATASPPVTRPSLSVSATWNHLSWCRELPAAMLLLLLLAFASSC